VGFTLPNNYRFFPASKDTPERYRFGRARLWVRGPRVRFMIQSMNSVITSELSMWGRRERIMETQSRRSDRRVAGRRTTSLRNRTGRLTLSGTLLASRASQTRRQPTPTRRRPGTIRRARAREAPRSVARVHVLHEIGFFTHASCGEHLLELGAESRLYIIQSSFGALGLSLMGFNKRSINSGEPSPDSARPNQLCTI